MVVPPAVDTERFRHSAEPPRFDLLTVGSLVPWKRTGDFLQVVAALRNERPDIRAAIAGVGALEETLRHEAARLGISDAVEFLGFQHDVETAYLRVADLRAPLELEGLPVSLLEAMSSGMAAVVSDVGEVRDVVTDGDTGCLFPAGDVESLRAVLSRLLEDPGLCERLGAAAATRVREYASVGAVAARYGQIFAPATDFRLAAGET